MASLTRYILISISFLTLFSCSTQNINGSYNYLLDKLIEDRIEINKAIKDLKYASSIIKIDKDDELLSVLASYDNGIERWVTSNDITIKVNQGKIVRTIGLEFDYEIIGFKGFTSKDNAAFLRFIKPNSGYLEIFFEYKTISTGSSIKPISDEEYNYKLIEETFSVPSIKWKGKNYYWVDEEDNIWLSKQLINPFGQKIRIKVLKKYSG